MFYYTHTEKARINQISPEQQHKSSHNSKTAPDTSIKSSHKSKTARNDDNKLRCMTWSGLRSSGVLTGAYTLVYVTRQYSRASLSDTRHTSFYVITSGLLLIIHTSFYATHLGLFIESVEFLYHRFRLISGFATYFFSIKIFLVIKLYTITTAVAPTLVII